MNILTMVSDIRLTVFTKRICLLVLGLLLVAGSLPMSQAEAVSVAPKKTVTAGPFAAGDEPIIQIDLTKPDLTGTPLAEVVFVIDTSGSLDDDISNLRYELRKFIDQKLRNVPGQVRVGITKIGNGTASWDSNNPPLGTVPGDSREAYVNREMFYSGTTDPKPNSQVGVDKVVTINGSNVQSLKDYVATIAVEPHGNPNTPDKANSYTSDIAAGIARGAGMFTSDNTAKFMLVLTDGQPNKGYCPIKADGKPQYSLPAGTQLQILGGGTERNKYVQTQLGTVDAKFPPSYPTDHHEPGVCQPFVSTFFSATGLRSDPIDGGLPDNSFLDELAKSYRNNGWPNSKKVVNVDTDFFDKIMDSIRVDSITITDTLNANVFSQATIFKGVYHCGDGFGAKVQSTGYIASGNKVIVNIYPGNVAKDTKFCVRFQGLIKSGVTPGATLPINTTSGNVVEYYNSSGSRLDYDNIAPGSITISGTPTSGVNLQPDNFQLTDSTGSPRRAFTTNEQIYVETDVKNILADASMSGATTRFYANEPNALVKNATNPYTLCLVHGPFGGNRTYEYGSYPGHVKEAQFNSCNGKTSWTMPSVGTYYGRAYVNVGRSDDVTETVYTDNQAVTRYGIYTPPGALKATATSCTSATFTWTKGTNVTGYKLRIKNVKKTTDQFYTLGDVATYTHNNLEDGPNTYEWGLIPQIDVAGTVVDGAEVAGSNFTTPACLSFDLTGNPSFDIIPGAPNPSLADVGVNYLPSPSNWQPSNTITLTIRDIVTGTSNCSAVPVAGGAVTMPKNGITATIGGNSSKVITAPTSPVSLGVKADSSVAAGSTFTLCLGAVSNSSSDQHMLAVPITVAMSAWFQVAGSTDTAFGAGDVHSNGAFGAMVVPSNPIQYFFRDLSQGVLSASSTSGTLAQLSRASNWKASNLGQTIKTSTWGTMLAAAEGKQAVTSKSATELQQVISSCNNGQLGNITYKSTGDIVLGSGGAVTFPSSCNGLNLTIYINGNLGVNNNVVDSTSSGTLTVVVKGNITVAPTVSQLDGVYMFDGQFNDGSSNSQLVVHGSILGLGGNLPGSTTGRIILSRDLGSAINENTPAEQIYFQPKYLYLLKDSTLGGTTFSWAE